MLVELINRVTENVMKNNVDFRKLRASTLRRLEKSWSRLLQQKERAVGKDQGVAREVKFLQSQLAKLRDELSKRDS